MQDHGLRFDLLGLGALVPEETVSVEEHETRFPEAMQAWKQAPSGWFCERGRTPDERGFIAVREGHVVGYGFVEADDLQGDLASAEVRNGWRRCRLGSTLWRRRHARRPIARGDILQPHAG